MITKLKCTSDVFKTIEFERVRNSIMITIEDTEVNEYLQVDLTEQNLFDLIGQLLRIQSEIRTEVKNG